MRMKMKILFYGEKPRKNEYCVNSSLRKTPTTLKELLKPYEMFQSVVAITISKSVLIKMS